MDLNYEETMRRINEYESNDPLNYKYCREIQYPYRIHVYSGEEQIIIVPLTTAIGWYSVEMAWHRCITDMMNVDLIGKTILEAFKYIKESPVDARTAEERAADSYLNCVTSCKSYKAFEKKYLFCTVICYEDGRYLIYPGGHNERKSVYPEEENKINLPANSCGKLIGQTVIKSFAEMKSFYENYKSVKPEIPRFEFETLSDMKISFKIPQGDGYTDEEDYSSSEIYQGYSYSKSEEDDEPVGHIYLGIAAELNCDLSSENVLNVFEKKYGSATQYEYIECEHSIFKYRAEIIGKNIHRILYLRQIDENELLSCELTVNTKKSGKRLDKKLNKDFESIVKSCKYVK